MNQMLRDPETWMVTLQSQIKLMINVSYAAEKMIFALMRFFKMVNLVRTPVLRQIR